MSLLHGLFTIPARAQERPLDLSTLIPKSFTGRISILLSEPKSSQFINTAVPRAQSSSDSFPCDPSPARSEPLFFWICGKQNGTTPPPLRRTNQVAPSNLAAVTAAYERQNKSIPATV